MYEFIHLLATNSHWIPTGTPRDGNSFGEKINAVLMDQTATCSFSVSVCKGLFFKGTHFTKAFLIAPASSGRGHWRQPHVHASSPAARSWPLGLRKAACEVAGPGPELCLVFK